MNIIEAILIKVKSILKNLLPKAREGSELAVTVLNDMKSGKTIPYILSYLPVEYKSKFEMYLNSAVIKAKLVDNYVDSKESEEILTDIYNGILDRTGTSQNIYLNSLGILLTDVFADGKVTWDDLVYVPKAIFNLRKKK